MAVHSRWPLMTGVAQGRYYCNTNSNGNYIEHGNNNKIIIKKIKIIFNRAPIILQDCMKQDN